MAQHTDWDHINALVQAACYAAEQKVSKDPMHRAAWQKIEDNNRAEIRRIGETYVAYEVEQAQLANS